MKKKTALATATTAVSIMLLLSSALAASAVGAAAPPPSTCTECCQDEAACDALGDLAGLHAAVDDLVLQAGLATSLDAKVDAVTASVLAGRPSTALNQLDAFGNELTAADQTGKVDAATSSVLKERADGLKQTINNLRG